MGFRRTPSSGRCLIPRRVFLRDLAPSTGPIQRSYKLPLLPPELAAILATTAEHIFPVPLLVGLATRLSALALLIMTIVIQAFVYPGAYPRTASGRLCCCIS